MNISEPQLMVPNDEHSISGIESLNDYFRICRKIYGLLSFPNAEHIQSSSKTGTSIYWVDKIGTERIETWRYY